MLVIPCLPCGLSFYGKRIVVFFDLTVLGYHFWTESPADGSIAVPGSWARTDWIKWTKRASRDPGDDILWWISGYSMGFRWDILGIYGDCNSARVNLQKTVAKFLRYPKSCEVEWALHCSLAEKKMFLIHMAFQMDKTEVLYIFICAAVLALQQSKLAPSKYQTADSMLLRKSPVVFHWANCWY